MRKILLILGYLVFCSLSVLGQQILNDKLPVYKQRTQSHIINGVVCPGIDEDHHSIIHAPDFIAKARQLRSQNQRKSQIIVTYVDFPEDAKAAFQRAIDIWEYLIYSQVPIRVTASWEALNPGILGSANAANFLLNFEGAPYLYTYYPIALAEKLAGKPLNSDSDPDIICRFNTLIPWHYGSAETIESGKFDLTTIVLHEIGHGLGFISSMNVSTADNTGYYGGGEDLKTIYDVFVQSVHERNLIDTSFYKNVSPGLYSELTGGDLYFGIDKGNARPKLYAPNPYQGGSSISHLDEATYPSGTINALMKPSARTMEVSHDPGPLALKMFYEMGWKHTTIVHTQNKGVSTNRPVTFKVNILSDTTLISNSAKMYYSSGGAISEAPLVNVPGTTEYAATLSFPAGTTEVRYYFEVRDSSGKTITSPGKNGVNSTQYIFSVKIGPDSQGPLIDHSPLKIEEVNYPVNFLTSVDDDYEEGVKSVVVKYSVNQAASRTIELSKYDAKVHGTEYSQGRNNDKFYLALNAISGLKVGDKITYQIEATDAFDNKTILPTEFTSTSSNAAPTPSFYEFTVTNLLSARNSYGTDFETAENDFATIGFSIKTEDGFSGKGLHSSHPYKNGLGLAIDNDVMVSFERTEIAMLRYPIIIGNTNTTITFDEVVLIEPGDVGATFGSSGFYDYVVAEFSLDGVNWSPIEDGYDSRSNKAWETLYNSSSSGGNYPNSTAKGSQIYSQKRTINLGSEYNLRYPGFPFLLRFVLFTDELTNGWGWSIDNLYIQENAPIVLANEEENISLKLSPNPSTDHMDIEWLLTEPGKVQIEIFSLGGSKIYEETVPAQRRDFRHRVRIAGFSSGTYVVKVSESKGAAFKRFVKL
jgi:hypothetical protein